MTAPPPAAVPAAEFEQGDGIALARLAGPRPGLQAAVDVVTRVLAAARGAGVERLVVDLTHLRGVPVPSLAERHAMVRAWAEAAGGRLVVAMACAPELMDPDRFGVVAAANFGLRSNVFARVDEAVAWLRQA
jgi:hypothetical protein